ncbi:hypothetical protein ABE10_10890 [Bacillus toyonensis]|nr:hypothetical protein [Bacillus toyonensis]
MPPPVVAFPRKQGYRRRHVPEHPLSPQLRAAHDRRRGQGGRPPVRPEGQRVDPPLPREHSGVRAGDRRDRPGHPPDAGPARDERSAEEPGGRGAQRQAAP